jgi:hypothetical protein
MRSFDLRAVGRLECRAWETYYRHEWGAGRPSSRSSGGARIARTNAICDPDDPRLAEERALLVRSYASLLAAVHR